MIDTFIKLESELQEAIDRVKAAIVLQIFQVILVVVMLVLFARHHAQDDKIEKRIERLGHNLTSTEDVLKVLNSDE
jgi:hypothetical protein